MASQIAASDTKPRAEILDILRGFALLGICLANASYFSMFIFQPPAEVALFPTAQTDQWLQYIHFALIEGKFYSLFSLLFGVGFAIIFFQKNAASTSGLFLFYRRLFFLMLFGLAHSFLLWDGDILFFYAITGAFLPLFRSVSNRKLILLAIILVFSPLLFDIIKVLTNGAWNISNPFLTVALETDKKNGITESNIPGWLILHDRYIDLRHWNQSGFWWSWQLRLDSNRVPKVLAMFLLGLYIGRTRFYTHLQDNVPLLRKLRAWGLGIGIIAGIAVVFFHADEVKLPKPGGLWDTLAYALNVAPLSIGYAATIALWYLKNPSALRWLQPVGQMALTNYIMQTVLGISIYYGIGLGFGGKIGPSYFMPIAVSIFILQVLYSRYWMNHFNYGPLEWIWRQLTYGKVLALRKTNRQNT